MQFLKYCNRSPVASRDSMSAIGLRKNKFRVTALSKCRIQRNSGIDLKNFYSLCWHCQILPIWSKLSSLRSSTDSVCSRWSFLTGERSWDLLCTPFLAYKLLMFVFYASDINSQYFLEFNSLMLFAMWTSIIF